MLSFETPNLSRTATVAFLLAQLFGCEGHGATAASSSRALAKLAPQRVSGTIQRHTRHLIHLQTERETLLVTPEHPFATLDSGWVAAGALSPNDWVVTGQSGAVRVAAVREEALRRPVTVFNLSVERTHAYLVGTQGVLVHNTGCSGLGESKADRLKRLVDLRLKIATNRLATQGAQAARQRFASAGKSTSEMDRHIAELEAQRMALMDQLAIERMRQLQDKELTDTGWMSGTRKGLERARLEALRRRLEQGKLSERELAEIERELARSEPVTKEYLAAIWRELDTLSRHEDLSRPLQELRKLFKELDARDQALEARASRGDTSHELVGERLRLQNDWRNEILPRLERARQQLEAARAAPGRRSERFEAELEEAIAFLEGERRKHGRGKRKVLSEPVARGERTDPRAQPTQPGDTEPLVREFQREEGSLSQALAEETRDTGHTLRSIAELLERSPSPERTSRLQSGVERLRSQLAEERNAYQAYDMTLAADYERLSGLRAQAGSSSVSAHLQHIGEERRRIRRDWQRDLQTRIDQVRWQLDFFRDGPGLRDMEAGRELALLEHELARFSQSPNF